MELWIRSQDREVLTKVVDIYKDADTNEIWSKSSFGIKNCLGIYATKERALEVLDEIQKYIADSFSRQEAEQFFGGFGTTRKSKVVYEMPKE